VCVNNHIKRVLNVMRSTNIKVYCNYYCCKLQSVDEHYATVPIVRHKKGKGCPYSINERRVPELIPVLGSQPAGDVSHKPGGRLPLVFARPAVTPATVKRAATNFAAW